MEIKGTRSPNFAKRLRESCDNHPDCPPLHRGRLAWLQKQLAEEGLKISVESVRKWLDGEGRPTQDKCETLAHVLGEDPAWLYMGKGTGDRREGKRSVDASSTGPMLPVAIRPGVVVEIKGLPLDLTLHEATKVANVVLAHAVVD